MNVQPVSYLQTDSEWYYWPYSNYNESTNIGRSGCGPTAMAMVIATWVDPTVTPVTTCKWSLNHGYKATGNGTYHSYFVPQAAAYGIECVRVNTSSLQNMTTANAAKYHQQAYDAVEEGHLVIVLCGPGVWTSGGHFILWYSNDADKNVYINDPASTKANRVKNTFEVLKQNARYYWICKVPKEVISMTNSEVKALIKSEVEAKANEMIPQYLASLQGSTPSSWAAQAWYSAAKAGVFDGSNPLMYITREQVATVLMRTGQIKALPVPSDIDWEDLNKQA